jgi:hypothetical protein
VLTNGITTCVYAMADSSRLIALTVTAHVTNINNTIVGEKSESFSGGFVRYTLTETYRRSLLFTPVSRTALLEADNYYDIVQRPRRMQWKRQTDHTENVAADDGFVDYWLELDFRTKEKDGLLIFAAAEYDFTLLDVRI